MTWKMVSKKIEIDDKPVLPLEVRLKLAVEALQHIAKYDEYAAFKAPGIAEKVLEMISYEA